MGRKFLMVVLGLGAVGGFAAGFAQLHHNGWCHGAACGRDGRQGEFERRVADTCTESALRVYNRQTPPGPKP